MGYSFSDLKSVFTEAHDPHDPWGSTMIFVFDLCAYLDANTDETEALTEMEYRPGAFGPIIEDASLEEIFRQTPAIVLNKFAMLINRYLDLLERHGKDY